MVENSRRAVEQVADRVYLAAQLFVRLFNQRGASLQQRILELLTVADAADNFHKRTLATSMGGRVASVVGSVTTITGLILAPFTFGSSIIVTAVGIGVATAGTITSASAHITDSVHSNFGRKKVEKMIEGYQEEVKDIRECMDFVQEGMDALQEWNFEKYTESVAKRALNRNIKHVVKEGARAGKALMINTDKLVSTVQVLSVAGGAAKAAQAISVTTGVMSALFLALDIFFLAKDSHDFRKGAKTKFAAKLREVCKELQDGLLLLNRVKTELQKTMDGIEVEEFEEEEEEEKSDLECDPEELALLEEEINQMEQKLDQQVQEKKRREEEEEKKNDSEEHHLKPPEDEKIGKSKKEGEGQKEEQRLVKESLLGVERGAGKHGTDKKLKEKIQDQDETKQKTKENQQDIQEEKKRAVDEKGISGKVEENEHWKSGEKQEDGHREKDQRTWTEQGESGKREKEQWKSPKRVEDDQKQKEQYNNDDQWKSTKKVVYGKQRKKTREWDERGRSGKSNRDEHEHSHKMEGDEQGKSRERGSNESGKREKNAVLSSLPPPARPRSKAFSNVPEEARCEGPVTEPKAPPPVPHRKRASHREPLSI
ncbi:hypothetical protein JZ751_018407 [Albula glossodonta]|uniref:Uncharacterized protein n=1 Tax=Albula glossodonta TaxID=121402 RepID=A0A8T2MVK7_9TELE|nr:hypothetical protein JZ751_018407 [Albula glossodonta]